MGEVKPKILLSAKIKKEHYTNAVNACGGIAVTEYCPVFSEEYDGLILCGGSDIHPMYYHEEINGSVDIDILRDEAEFKLFKQFCDAGKPILGICRGCQLINIALGGSLYQDISNASEHTTFGGQDLVHRVVAKEGNFLSDLYGTEFFVNSAHHQAIKEVGSGIEVIVTADEGKTVEAIMHRELPIYAVQWHPERMSFQNKRSDTVDGAGVFEFFIGLCKRS